MCFPVDFRPRSPSWDKPWACQMPLRSFTVKSDALCEAHLPECQSRVSCIHIDFLRARVLGTECWTACDSSLATSMQARKLDQLARIESQRHGDACQRLPLRDPAPIPKGPFLRARGVFPDAWRSQPRSARGVYRSESGAHREGRAERRKPLGCSPQPGDPVPYTIDAPNAPPPLYLR